MQVEVPKSDANKVSHVSSCVDSRVVDKDLFLSAANEFSNLPVDKQCNLLDSLMSSGQEYLLKISEQEISQIVKYARSLTSFTETTLILNNILHYIASSDNSDKVFFEILDYYYSLKPQEPEFFWINLLVFENLWMVEQLGRTMELNMRITELNC